MRNFDKLVAAVLVAGMALFWVMISPAGITSRTSEAMPTAINQPAHPEIAAQDKIEKRQQKQRQEAVRISNAETKRLKIRSKDTPPQALEQLRRGIQEPVTIGQRNEHDLQNFDTIPGLPTVH